MPFPDRPGLGLTCRSPVDGAGVHGDVLLWQGRRVLGDDVRTLIAPEVTVGRNPLEVYGPGTSSGQGSQPPPGPDLTKCRKIECRTFKVRHSIYGTVSTQSYHCRKYGTSNYGIYPWQQLTTVNASNVRKS